MEETKVKPNDMEKFLTIEKELLTLGFIPTERVHLKINTGYVTRFIKATTSDGYITFIDLDQDGLFVFDKKDDRFLTPTMVSLVPESLIKGAIESISMEIPGIMFDCNDKDYCEIKRNATSDLIMNNYVYISNDDKSFNLVGKLPIAFPIVKLSDIRKNSKDVINSVTETTQRLHSQNIQNISQQLEVLKSNFKRSQEKYDEFLENKTKAQNALDKGLQNLKEIPDEKLTDETRKLLKDQIRKRIEYYPKLFRTIDNVLRINDLLNQVNTFLDETSKELKQTYEPTESETI